MSFWTRLFGRGKKEEVRKETEEMPPVSTEEEKPSALLMDYKEINMEDEILRSRYIMNCLEQMADATEQIEELEKEYQTVSAYLEDTEKLDKLPAGEKRVIALQAKAIDNLNVDREKYKDKKLILTEEEYRSMYRMEEEAPEAIEKLKEAENYQELVRQDLQKLEGEKQAFLYRRHEAQTGLENLRGMAVICSFAVAACFLVLLILQFGFDLEVKVGYILTTFTAAVTLLLLYIKYQDALRESRILSNSINKIILLQNKVKIRYVNNTNLLEYLHVKYHVDSSEALEKLWKGYNQEKEVRERMRRTEENLDYHESELVEMLKECKLFDPMIWIHRAVALYNPKEMVEVRHDLILQRQKLRKQMEFNKETADRAESIIGEIVGDYPAYANEILKMVSDFHEKKDKK